MIRFLEGPANGVTLVLERAPLFLRVCRNEAGQWDALDQLSDTPEPGEEIWAYRREGEVADVHLPGEEILARREGEVADVHLRMAKPAQSGWRKMATYRYIEEQPSRPILVSTNGWREWCAEQVESPKTRSRQ